jgi:hypothetical protein
MEQIKNAERGQCSLLIYGDYIDFQEIENALNLQPTHTAEKGEPILGGKLGYCETNCWFYDIDFKDHDDLSNSLKFLLSQIRPQKEKLKRLVKEVAETDIYIKIAVQSDYAQMGFEIKPELQKLIAEMEFPLWFSIVSFGMAGDAKDDGNEDDF